MISKRRSLRFQAGWHTPWQNPDIDATVWIKQEDMKLTMIIDPVVGVRSVKKDWTILRKMTLDE